MPITVETLSFVLSLLLLRSILHQRDDLLSGFFEIILSRDRKGTSIENASSFVHIRTLKTNDQRYFQAELLASLFNAIGNDRTVNDSTEDVHQNSFDLHQAKT